MNVIVEFCFEVMLIKVEGHAWVVLTNCSCPTEPAVLRIDGVFAFSKTTIEFIRKMRIGNWCQT